MCVLVRMRMRMCVCVLPCRCEDRHRAGQGATEWVTLPLPDLLVIAKPDIYTCSRFQLPSVSSMSEDEADLVEMKINHDNGLFMHHS